MQREDVEELLKLLVESVEMLCRQTADLVEDRASSALYEEDKPRIRLRADEIRVAGRELQNRLADSLKS